MRLLLSAFITINLLLLASPTTTHAQTGQLCFDVPTITNCIEGRFRAYWEENGGLAVFGYPISAAANRTSAEGTFLTQDFERNRFELHPENARPYDVLLGRLGDDLLKEQGLDWQTFTRSQQREDCLWFPQTQHNVCDYTADGGGFRAYWSSHGLQDPALDSYQRSLALFGLPLSEAGFETNASGDTVLTQWFERARIEWHPDNPAEFRVLLGLLGSEDRDDTAAPPRTLPTDAAWVRSTDRISAAAPYLPMIPMPKGNDYVNMVAAPDGSRIVYDRQVVIGASGFELISIDPRTAATSVLLETPNGVTGLVFAPDSKSLAMVVIEQSSWRLQVLDLASGNTRTLRTGQMTDRVLIPLAWTPRGIVVADAIWGSDAPLSRLAHVDPADGDRTLLYEDDFWGATASRDGRRIALLTGNMNLGGTPNLALLALDTTNGQTNTLTKNMTSYSGRAMWSPDGSKLVYCVVDYTMDNPTYGSTLRVINADGSNARALFFAPLTHTYALRDAGWRDNNTLAVLVATNDEATLYDLPANDLELENLTERATFPGEAVGNANSQIIYLPSNQ